MLPQHQRPLSTPTETLYNPEPIQKVPEVVHPEDLTPEQQKEYKDMVKNVENYWLEADKANYPKLFEIGKRPTFELGGKKYEVIEHIPGREYMLGPNGEEQSIPPEIKERVERNEEKTTRRSPMISHKPPKRAYYDYVRQTPSKENYPILANTNDHPAPTVVFAQPPPVSEFV